MHQIIKFEEKKSSVIKLSLSLGIVCVCRVKEDYVKKAILGHFYVLFCCTNCPKSFVGLKKTSKVDQVVLNASPI